ncbi:hypothetical protein C8R48DRAFT_673175 [Suillus tomentosus]|nr:hypothetical protein C8R48DRAFT_673175 [Suillus tomentosus]
MSRIHGTVPDADRKPNFQYINRRSTGNLNTTLVRRSRSSFLSNLQCITKVGISNHMRSGYQKNYYYQACPNSEVSACFFDLGTPEDLRKPISCHLHYIGRHQDVGWININQIESGGHVTNPGFLSNQGNDSNRDVFVPRQQQLALIRSNTHTNLFCLIPVNNFSDPDFFYGSRGDFNNFVLGSLEKYSM